MTIEKLPSGSYRVRPQINGRRYTLVFDHKPTEKEITIKMAEKFDAGDIIRDSFKNCAVKYIESKSNVLSPSTIRGYNSVLRAIEDDFLKKKISDINQIDIQLVVNNYAVKHTPKSVRNLHGFISAVLGQYRPNLIINTTLPQKVKYEPYVPSEEDIKRILEASENTPYHIAFQLGCLGLRRSEVCALQHSDLEGNNLSISKAKVCDKNNKWLIKNYTKTTEGKRTIFIPQSLVDEINNCETICDFYPNTLVVNLNKLQDRLGIPRFRFHDLRHFYASYAHSKGMSDADILASGGWASTYVMTSVYRHALEKEKEKEQQRIADGLFS